MEVSEARRPPPSAEEVRVQGARESIELSRQRVVHDLELTPHERRREQLTAALAFLDEQLRQLG